LREEDRLTFVEVPSREPSVGFVAAVAEGLRARPRYLPTRFLYDRNGSDLFERITRLPEYYLTRSESEILSRNAGEIVASAGPEPMLVEFGSGSSCKTRWLIEAALERSHRLTYVPIDISAEFLRATALNLLGEYEQVRIHALAAEYFDGVDALPEHDGARLILFLGSNIGNFARDEAVEFLGRIARRMNGRDRILIGIDMAKDPAVIEAAYNDGQGVTAAFNKNLLVRINRELGGEFNTAGFEHQAPYDPDERRVEMKLVSLADQTVPIRELREEFRFAEREEIHTEWSHKYTLDSFAALAAEAGLAIVDRWGDARDWFSVLTLRKVDA
jgi:L-histidine Nalpha-methyltransferase